MPILPGMITRRRSTNRMKGMCVCPHTTIWISSGSSLNTPDQPLKLLSARTTASSFGGVPWQNMKGPKPSTSTVTGCRSRRALRSGWARVVRLPTVPHRRECLLIRRGPGKLAPGRHSAHKQHPFPPFPERRQQIQDLSWLGGRRHGRQSRRSTRLPSPSVPPNAAENRQHAMKIR